MEFGILGPLAVQTAGGAVEIRRGTARSLLVALTVKAPEVVPVTTLADMLWGERQPQNPANALQLQVSYLRKTLAPHGGGAAIVTRLGGYALDLEGHQVDARRFEELVRDADRVAAGGAGDLREALALLDQALHLWRGEPLADAADLPFVLGEVTRLSELRWTAIERRHDLLLGVGRHDEVVSAIAAVLVEQPLRERLHEQLALALYRAGRQADALRRIEAARVVLRDELGVDLGRGLQELERQILDHDRGLDWRSAREVDSSRPADQAAHRTRMLPVPLTPIIGREAEITRVHDLLARHRLVTLTGPGGAGKSRLALEVAHAEVSDDAVWFIDLGSVFEDALVGPTVAAAVGIPTGPGDDSAQAVALAVARDRTLFVLDTCEHVIIGAADVAAHLLSTAPGARVLATSRRPLGLTGEIAWPVPPLPVAPPTSSAEEVRRYPSAALFCARAGAVRADFEVTDENAGDIAAICLALDGLPLAIELAAARADVLTPAAIRARLHNRFDLLVDGSREAAPRQQTLRSELDWSFELLSEDQRLYFARLSVFHGSFDIDAAAAVAGNGLGDELRLLTDLVRQSLVVALAGDRYRLLDTLRMYALQLLEPAEEASARARHAAYFVTLAETADPGVRSDDQLEWLERLRADVTNLRVAADWSFESGDGHAGARLAGALAWFWILNGMLGESIRHLERAVATPNLPPLVRAKALWGYALLAASLGQLERARNAAAESVGLARQAGDDAMTGRGLNARAVVEWASGEHDAAAATHDEAIELFARAGDPWGLAICTVLRARTALDQGDDRAGPMAEAGLAAARVAGDRHVIGIALEQIARVERAHGSASEVIATGTQALAAQESIGYTEGIIAVLHLLGAAHTQSARLEIAESLHRRALTLADRIGHAAAVCEALEGLAEVRAAQGRDEESLRLLVVADAERERLHLPARAPDEIALQTLRGEIAARLPSAPEIIQEASRLSVADLVSSILV